MKCAFMLSQDELVLAKAEVELLLKPKILEEDGPFLVAEVDDKMLYLIPRLAYTKRALQLFITSDEKNLDSEISNFDWNIAIKESFAVRGIRLRIGDVEKKYAGFIWDRLDNPKVDLKNPATKVYVLRSKDNFYVGTVLGESYGNFEYRRNKYKPKMHPTTMHPKFARFIINISGVTEGVLLDPFCGAGGIILEGHVLGYDVIGYDIVQAMLNRCEENLIFFKVEGFELRNRNAKDIIDRADLIVTDVPYGRCSSLVDSITATYKGFLESSYNMTDRMVVVFPHFVDYKPLFGKWKMEHEIPVKIHGGLTRMVTILSK